MSFVLIQLTVFCLLPDVVDSQFSKQVDSRTDIIDIFSLVS